MTPMTIKQIEEARARAQAVVDGFKMPNQQNARDAAKLAEQLIARERQVATLAQRLAAKDRMKGSPLDSIFDL